MTTNKPEVVAWGVPNSRLTERQPFMQLLHTQEGTQYPELLDPLIRLSDYEALQAECEKLRKDAARYRWLRDGASMLTDLNPWEDVGFVCAVYVCTEYGSQTALTDEELDAAIDAAMQRTTPQEGRQ